MSEKINEEIKSISISTWITILTIIVGFGVSYGIMQTNLKVIENQILDFKHTSEKGSDKLEIILRSLAEQQREIDLNATEIRHLRELREQEKNK